MGSKFKTLKFWEDEDYYNKSKEGSLVVEHPGMKKLFELSSKADSIADLGCGEGTRLNWFVNGRKINALGVDVSKTAVNIAKRQYPNINFKIDDLSGRGNLGKFKLVYSAYVLEHLIEPKKFIDAAAKLVKDGGYLAFLAPNFGSPNRRSPNSLENKAKKLLIGFINDFFGTKELNWQKVFPQKDNYEQPDDDALSEPYILSLIRYLKFKGLKVEYNSSFWELESWSLNPRKSLFKLFGILKLFPFKYWGPQFLIIAKKDG